MSKDKHNLLMAICITLIFVCFHLSKERPFSVLDHKLALAADFVTDVSNIHQRSGEATVNDWERLLHNVIDHQ
ncbi:hypothetical protein [Neobacillus fumarioli]|uniref:hypothetical protein n=1 Tax=Neobacillus fumarioli TaxID=105229 RepID=UPI0008319588|nr:hypothetical protein [Neobacillus fumarioli]